MPYVNYFQTVKQQSGVNPLRSVAVSDRSGNFQLPVPSGPGKLSFRFPVYGYWAPCFANSDRQGDLPSIAVDIPEAGEVPAVNIPVAHGLVLKGTIRDSEGKPAVGAAVRAESRNQYYLAKTDELGHFKLSNLSPRAEVQISASLGSAIADSSLPADATHPWDKTRVENIELTLKPGVVLTGRVLEDKEPEAGVLMVLHRSTPANPNQFRECADVKTGEDGSFAAGGLTPGDHYYFEIHSVDGSADPEWTHQTPYISEVPQAAKEKIELPDVNLIGMSQTLSGIVVDPRGNMVADATVSAGVVGKRVGHLSRRPDRSPPWTQTDAQGHFELTDLPDKQIELMVYQKNTDPNDRVIRRAATCRPSLNQRDIRIVYDPLLNAHIEDLDSTK